LPNIDNYTMYLFPHGESELWVDGWLLRPLAKLPDVVKHALEAGTHTFDYSVVVPRGTHPGRFLEIQDSSLSTGVSISHWSQAQLANGDFEVGLSTETSRMESSASLFGWTVAGRVQRVRSGAKGWGFAQSGSYFVSLGGNSSIAQELHHLRIGANYSLRLHASTSSSETPGRLEVYLGDQEQPSLSISNHKEAMTEYSILFASTSRIARLRLVNAWPSGAQDDHTANIDAVIIDQLPADKSTPTVPTPSGPTPAQGPTRSDFWPSRSNGTTPAPSPSNGPTPAQVPTPNDFWPSSLVR